MFLLILNLRQYTIPIEFPCIENRNVTIINIKIINRQTFIEQSKIRNKNIQQWSSFFYICQLFFISCVVLQYFNKCCITSYDFILCKWIKYVMVIVLPLKGLVL